ncbi:FtsH protease activity modulator HflK [Helicovermis profundi]|uniref:Protein HflK n=1 Tax=Helicovermis profundi TaxID=3065157 RepID=A0AAU9ELW4_9FIRM|nr:FtsH protease activity modulator HflK [Clostridia bacterium S502]
MSLLKNKLKNFTTHTNLDPESISEESENNTNKRSSKLKTIKTLLILPLIIISIIFVTSLAYTVDETQQAVVTTLGKVTDVKSAGLHFKLPYPIQSVKKVAVNKTQKMQIGYASTNNSEKSSQVNDVVAESKMITGDFNIVKIDFFIEWKISDPVKYLYNSNKPIDTLRMIAQSSARSIVGSKGVDGVLTVDKPIIQNEIKDKMLKKLESYDLGIAVLDIKIQDSEPPTEKVKAAFKNVETAKQEKETRINEALEYKNKTIPAAESKADKLVRDAEAYKASRINEANGDVAKFNAMYTEYAKNKTLTKTRMYLETIEKVFPDMTIYIESSSGDVQKMLPLQSFISNNLDENTKTVEDKGGN